MSRTHHHGRTRKRLSGLNQTQRAYVIRCDIRRDDPVLRKVYQRAHRQKTRNALQREQWEECPMWRATRGWLTW